MRHITREALLVRDGNCMVATLHALKLPRGAESPSEATQGGTVEVSWLRSSRSERTRAIKAVRSMRSDSLAVVPPSSE